MTGLTCTEPGFTLPQQESISDLGIANQKNLKFHSKGNHASTIPLVANWDPLDVHVKRMLLHFPAENVAAD